MNELKECCEILVTLLARLLKEGSITRDEYLQETILKMKFLKEKT